MVKSSTHFREKIEEPMGKGSYAQPSPVVAARKLAFLDLIELGNGHW